MHQYIPVKKHVYREFYGLGFWQQSCVWTSLGIKLLQFSRERARVPVGIQCVSLFDSVNFLTVKTFGRKLVLFSPQLPVWYGFEPYHSVKCGVELLLWYGLGQHDTLCHTGNGATRTARQHVWHSLRPHHKYRDTQGSWLNNNGVGYQSHETEGVNGHMRPHGHEDLRPTCLRKRSPFGDRLWDSWHSVTQIL